tara:strand:- start:919 stop:2673 length:1755 start_codon:yes stop_codon:yes gene_type:complete
MDEEKDEGIDVDALDKTLEKLTKVVERLTKSLEGFTSQTDKGTKSSKVDHDKIHKQNMERQAEYFANVKAMKLLSAELKGGGNSMKMFSNLMSKGVTTGYVFEKLTKHTNNFITSNEKLRNAQEEMAKMVEKYGSAGDKDGKGKDDRWASAPKEDRQKMQKLQKDTDGKEGSKLADQLGGAKEFFSKHKMGMMIGAGSAGILLKVLKMAFDASPMFQQIQKMLKFGIMMILRPIGDFFGFIMRPVMIMLLRKFIIPWYTKMYPQMMKWGTEIGSKLAGALTALMNGDIAGAFAALWGEVDWGTTIWNAIKAVLPILAISDLIAGILGEGNGDGFNYIGREIRKWFDEGILAITPEWDAYWTSVQTWFDDGVKGINDDWDSYWTGVNDWFSKGVLGISDDWNKMWTDYQDWARKGLKDATAYWSSIFWNIYSWIAMGIHNIADNWSMIFTYFTDWIDKGLTGITANWQQVWDNFLDWINPLTNNSSTKTSESNSEKKPFDIFNSETWADGGHITEPILGIGKSGKSYLMGEAGNETVIPDNQLGGASGGITINIQNMSGSQQDLSNLKQTILDVMQQSSTRRGRV